MYNMRCSTATVSVLVFAAFQVIACENSTQNSKREVKKYGENKKIFLGYKLGMTKEDFYDRSWELNDKKLVRQGPSNQSVYYELEDELEYPASMYFYPSFYNEKVYQMRVRFKYDNWAPWNKELNSDELQKDILYLFQKWYGSGFRKKFIKRKGEKVRIYEKRDKNRRIVISKKDSKDVIALITDVVALKEKRE